LPLTQTRAPQSAQKTLIFVSLTIVPALQVVAMSVPPVPTTEYHTLKNGPLNTPQGTMMSSVASLMSTVAVSSAMRTGLCSGSKKIY
jgi:hypothetical protein